ncbi:hypothetical protein F4861DRAFT_522612, partial [Xylaria intraflava]
MTWRSYMGAPLIIGHGARLVLLGTPKVLAFQPLFAEGTSFDRVDPYRSDISWLLRHVFNVFGIAEWKLGLGRGTMIDALLAFQL